ncbi:SHOCT domain-containing protein [Paenibacillus sp. P26]|nr:SHOCT domain-containing protein [Paenibacillus sp. P26]UUZ94801.1 SHOCT domain-containing protein [Paenibacillus sp. P25]
MISRGRIRPSKASSLMGMIVGGVFVVIGLTVISSFGWFGVFWTLMALGITIGHAVNFFGKRGISSWEVEMQPPEQRAPHRESAVDFETKLRRLERLKAEGLITEEEYHRKRAEILAEKW